MTGRLLASELAARFRRMPALIKVGAVLSPIVASIWLLGMIFALAGLPVGWLEMSVGYGDVEITQHDLAALAFIAALATTAWGFWTERRWARYTAVSFWVLVLAVGVGATISRRESPSGLLFGLAVVACAAWYFFGKAAVVAYYARLAARDASLSDAASAGNQPAA